MNERKLLTLCIVHQHPRVLLGMKKRGFGAGHWNGFGGKVEQGETIEAAAARELREEAGIHPVALVKTGILEFTFNEDPVELEIHIFRVPEFAGEPKESDEMKPEWFHVDDIPFPRMWADDIHWFPLLLAGKKFAGKFVLDRPSSETYTAKLVAKTLYEVADVL